MLSNRLTQFTYSKIIFLKLIKSSDFYPIARIKMAKKKGSKEFTIFEKSVMLTYYAEGKTFSWIGKQLKRDISAVRRFLIKCRNDDGTVEIKETEETRGRKRKTSPTTDRGIIIQTKRNRFITAKELKASLPAGIDLSLNTIRSRIKESGEFNSYWAARKPFISKSNRIKRLAWARDHVNWSLEQWRRVMWTDESPYVLRFNGKTRVWRMHNERYNPVCCKANVKHDDKIMVWGAFAAHGVGILHRIMGIMDRFVYLDLCQNVMLPSADMLFGRENWLFQQDNDPKHTAIIVRDFIEEENIPTLEWPAQSPDLNPIENLWSILDQRLKRRQVNNCQELFRTLNDEWKRLPVDLLERLVASMPSRCQAVIDSEGWPTKY